MQNALSRQVFRARMGHTFSLYPIAVSDQQIYYMFQNRVSQKIFFYNILFFNVSPRDQDEWFMI